MQDFAKQLLTPLRMGEDQTALDKIIQEAKQWEIEVVCPETECTISRTNFARVQVDDRKVVNGLDHSHRRAG